MQVKQLFKDMAKYNTDIAYLKNEKADKDHIHRADEIFFDSKSYSEGNVLFGKEDVQNALDSIGGVIDNLTSGGGSVAWGAITGKPFNTVGNTLEAPGGVLNVNQNLFAPKDHLHTGTYAPISHSNNNSIHITTSDKTNIDKVPNLEQSVSNLNSIVTSSTKQYLVKTLAQRDALKELNHCDICHVTDEKKSYIYEKQEVNGNAITPEWILFSEFTTVDLNWSNVTNKPFATVGDGLTVTSQALKVNVDNTTIESTGSQIKVKDNVFAPKTHSHDVTWNDILQKPTTFSANLTSTNFVDSDSLVYATVTHNLNNDNVLVKAYGSDKQERFIGIEKVSVNAVKIWSDIKESLNVTVTPLV